MAENNIYARVSDKGVVTEYPVLALHITNRAHPVSWYTLCKYDTKPTITNYQYLKEVLEVSGNKVLVHYTIVERTLSQVLSLFRTGNDLTNPTPKDISALTTEDILKVQELASVEVQKRLDAFALERGYDDIKSLATYANSSIPSFAADAVIGLALRDQCWDNLNTYLTDVQAGTSPVPLTVTEMLTILPDLVWV